MGAIRWSLRLTCYMVLVDSVCVCVLVGWFCCVSVVSPVLESVVTTVFPTLLKKEKIVI